MSFANSLEFDADGAFLRKESKFKNKITADGSSGFKAEKNRYHLYVSLACPWANRTLIVRKLKGLEDAISVTVVDYLLNFETGWEFTDQKPGCSLDPLMGATYLREIYLKADPGYAGSATVPVLWDKVNKTIVSNESSEIMRMLNSEFNAFCANEEQLDLCPRDLRGEIEQLNMWIYPAINNGVYRAGFAKSQSAYDEAIEGVFSGLERVEEMLQHRRYLAGQFSEADIRLFCTLVRFDSVYHGHFKCNKKRIVDYPNMWNYTREIYQMKAIGETVNMEHIKKHYEMSHRSINPYGIVSIGPALDFSAPHDRQRLKME